MRKGQRLAPAHRFTVTLNSVETKLKWGDVIEDYIETFSVDLQKRIINLSVLEDRDRRVSRFFMNMVETNHESSNSATDFQLVHTDPDTKARLIFENVTIINHLLEGYGYGQTESVTHRVELAYKEATLEPKDPPVH